MAKTRTITATFPDGTVVTRKTARTYTHVVASKGNIHEGNTRWCGREDLMLKTKKLYKNPTVATVTDNQGAN